MRPEAKAFIFAGVLSVAALALALLFREWNIKQAAVKQTQVTPKTEEPAPVTSGQKAAAMDRQTCEKSGSTWNNCGSACRGKPADTACIELCVPMCECTAGNSWQCPAGYGCREYVKEKARGEVGVCLPGKKEQPPVQDQKTVSSIFMSQDKVTTVDLSQLLVDGRFVIQNPATFHGTSTAFENTINWSLLDSAGTVVSYGFANVSSPDMGIPGPFAITMFYDRAPTMKNGVLRVFESSAKDGSPIHEVSVPVEFRYLQSQGCSGEVSVAFPNIKKDPQMLDCSKVFFVKRKVCGDMTLNDLIAVHELLKGPSAEEKKAGYLTSLPENVDLPTITKRPDGTVHINFNETLEQGVGGSCRVFSIRSQILKTLEANGISSADKEAVISIDGRTEDILQP